MSLTAFGKFLFLFYFLDCVLWPSSDRWKARRVFCEENDGYSSLCDCEKPFDFADGKVVV